MLDFLDAVSYPALLLLALILFLSPFRHMPHAVEKILLLREGRLRRPVDIFDLFLHLSPAILLVVKLLHDFA